MAGEEDRPEQPYPENTQAWSWLGEPVTGALPMPVDGEAKARDETSLIDRMDGLDAVLVRGMGNAFKALARTARRSGMQRLSLEGAFLFGPLVAMGWILSFPLYVGTLCGEWTNEYDAVLEKKRKKRNNDDMQFPVSFCTFGMIGFLLCVGIIALVIFTPPVAGHLLATGLLSLFIGIASTSVMALRMDEAYKHLDGDDAPTQMLLYDWRLRPIKTLVAKLYWMALGPLLTWLLAGFIIGLIVG